MPNYRNIQSVCTRFMRDVRKTSKSAKGPKRGKNADFSGVEKLSENSGADII